MGKKYETEALAKLLNISEDLLPDKNLPRHKKFLILMLYILLNR